MASHHIPDGVEPQRGIMRPYSGAFAWLSEQALCRVRHVLITTRALDRGKRSVLTSAWRVANLVMRRRGGQGARWKGEPDSVIHFHQRNPKPCAVNCLCMLSRWLDFSVGPLIT